MICRNAALLVAIPNPEQFDTCKLIKRLVGYEEHYRFNYTTNAGEVRSMTVDYCAKETQVQLALLEDLGLARGSQVMASTHEELHCWCLDPNKYKNQRFQALLHFKTKRKCPMCNYATKKSADMARHCKKLHKEFVWEMGRRVAKNAPGVGTWSGCIAIH